MSGVKDGLNKVAGGGDSDDDLVRGEGGYNGETEGGRPEGGTSGSGVRRGVGGYNGEPGAAGGSEGGGKRGLQRLRGRSK